MSTQDHTSVIADRVVNYCEALVSIIAQQWSMKVLLQITDFGWVTIKKDWRKPKWKREKNSIWKRSDNRKKAIEKNLHIFCSNLNGSNWFSTVQQKAFLSFCQDGEKNLLVAASMLQKPIQCLNGWMFEWSNVWLVESSNVKMTKCSIDQMFKWPNVQMTKCSNDQMFQWLNVRMVECSDVWMVRCLNIQMFEWLICQIL